MCDSYPQSNANYIHAVVLDQCKKYRMVWEMLGRRDFYVYDWFGIDLEWLNLWSFLKIYNFDKAIFIAHDNFDYMFLLRVLVRLIHDLMRVFRVWWRQGLGIECELHCWYFTFNWRYDFALVIPLSLTKVIDRQFRI